MTNPTSRLLRILLTLALIGGTASAGQTEPKKLTDLRASYQKEFSKVAAPQLRTYRIKLRALEAKYVKEKQYREAAVVRRERLTVEKQLGLTAVSGKDIVLAADKAKPGEGVSFDAAAKALVGWKNAGASAEWDLPSGIKSGGFDVELEYACGAGQGGELVLKETFYFLKRAVRGTGGKDKFKKVALGTLRLKNNASTLTIEARTPKSGGLFRLRSVKLIAARTS